MLCTVYSIKGYFFDTIEAIKSVNCVALNYFECVVVVVVVVTSLSLLKKLIFALTRFDLNFILSFCHLLRYVLHK